MVDQFDDIRPYRDDEVRPVLDHLLGDADLIGHIARLKAPRLAALAPFLVHPWVKARLQSEFGAVQSVAEFQQAIRVYIDRMLARTTTSLSSTGLEALPMDTACLFVSNHRDIVMDPAVVNYVRILKGFPSTRIAIGDNLLKNSRVADMMRLNKSFVVRREPTSPRAMRDAFFRLSAYIHQSIADGHFIWIAQREGRAKDGCDRTDPAIIKMFHLSQKKSARTLAEVIRSLHIVPVAVSYEYDPCDLRKARELAERERSGQYVKSATEDQDSILLGITGFKGRVHVAFGTPLTGDYENAGAVASEIDRQIIQNYRLYPSNIFAYEQLRQRYPQRNLPDLDGLADKGRLPSAEDPVMRRRVADCPPELLPYLLAMYANPVISRYVKS